MMTMLGGRGAPGRAVVPIGKCQPTNRGIFTEKMCSYAQEDTLFLVL